MSGMGSWRDNKGRNPAKSYKGEEFMVSHDHLRLELRWQMEAMHSHNNINNGNLTAA